MTMQMRPVERGPDPKGGWDSWGPEAANALAARMGWYCSYCEVRLSTGPHVEHKLPKEHHADLKFAWPNWLLACTNCNSTKSDKDTPLTDSLWPDRDNTARAFAYGVGGVVSVAAGLPAATVPLAQKLRDIVGLDRQPGHPMSRMADRRWQHRLDAYDKAVVARAKIAEAPTDAARRDLAVLVAQATGFFSVWMAVFREDKNMRARLIAAFPVADDCYDADATEIPRPGGLS